MAQHNITTASLIGAASSAINLAGKAGRRAAAIVACGVIWNNHFARDYGQEVIPPGDLRQTLMNLLIEQGNNVKSSDNWTTDGQRLAKSHGPEIEGLMREYLRTSNHPLRSKMIEKVVLWAIETFPTGKIFEEQVNPKKKQKTEAEKERAARAALINAVNRQKSLELLYYTAELARLKYGVLSGRLDAAKKAQYHKDIAEIIRMYQPKAQTVLAQTAAEAAAEAEDTAAEDMLLLIQHRPRVTNEALAVAKDTSEDTIEDASEDASEDTSEDAAKAA